MRAVPKVRLMHASVTNPRTNPRALIPAPTAVPSALPIAAPTAPPPTHPAAAPGIAPTPAAKAPPAAPTAPPTAHPMPAPDARPATGDAAPTPAPTTRRDADMKNWKPSMATAKRRGKNAFSITFHMSLSEPFYPCALERQYLARIGSDYLVFGVRRDDLDGDMLETCEEYPLSHVGFQQ